MRTLPHKVVKRWLDLSVAVPAFILTIPLQVTIAVAVRAKLGSPILFRQQRPGVSGIPFTMLKFRTMLPMDEQNNLITDEDRLTTFGAALRSTSLDELPALWNVIRGDMSIVGPRPLLPEYLDLYTPAQARRHEVRPGITGLAQVNGRNTLPWEDRFALDLKYVEDCSLKLDLQIIIKTLFVVIQRRGVSADNVVTMSKFTGTQSKTAAP